MDFHLYVDDSGNREYDGERDYKTSGKSRHFVYGALLIERRESSLLVTRLRELKTLTFRSPDVEVKSNWIRIPKERTDRYLDRYGIGDEQLSSFVDKYYELVLLAPLMFIGAVVDKLHMQEKYIHPWYAPTLAYEVLMQRVMRALAPEKTLSVTVDDITGKTPKASEYKNLMREHHTRLCRRGSILQPSISFKGLLEPLKFMNSAHSDLIQVADLAAYNLQRQFRDYGEHWEQTPSVPTSLPMYPHFKRICGKFYRDAATRRIQGFGVVKVPLVNQVRWVVSPEEGEKL